MTPWPCASPPGPSRSTSRPGQTRGRAERLGQRPVGGGGALRTQPTRAWIRRSWCPSSIVARRWAQWEEWPLQRRRTAISPLSSPAAARGGGDAVCGTPLVCHLMHGDTRTRPPCTPPPYSRELRSFCCVQEEAEGEPGGPAGPSERGHAEHAKQERGEWAWGGGGQRAQGVGNPGVQVGGGDAAVPEHGGAGAGACGRVESAGGKIMLYPHARLVRARSLAPTPRSRLDCVLLP